MKKEIVIAALSSIEEKDFDALLKSVEAACIEEEKAKEAYKGFDAVRGTLQQYRTAEQKWKFATLQKILRLTAFFELFTGKSSSYNGRSFVRRTGPEGKLCVNDKGFLAIEGAELKKGDEIDLLINGIWIPVKVDFDEDAKEWQAQGLRGLPLFGRKARKAVALDKAEVNKKINEKR